MKLFATMLASSTLAVGAAAADPLTPESMSDDEWRFAVTGYGFLPMRTWGSSAIAGSAVDIDIDLADALEVLNFAISGRGEAWRGDFGFIVDGYYFDMGGGGDIELPGPGPGTVGIDVAVNQGWVGMFGAYRVSHGTYDDAGRRYSVDLQGGVRFNTLKQKVTATVDIGPGPGVQTTLGGTETWWEPVIGARAKFELGDDWSAAVLGDIGGFGVDGSDLHWKVTGGVEYHPWEQTSLKFGWQVYGIDFSTTRSDGTFAYDIMQHGPYMALTYQFQ